jgi:RecA-family ATPase
MSDPEHDGYPEVDGPELFGDIRDDRVRRRIEQLENDPPELAALRPHMMSAAELQGMEFAPLRSYIDGIIIEGLTIIGGKPKLGKSAFMLAAGLAIATGGVAFGKPDRSVTQAPVLYLALEDGPRRLQDRMGSLLGSGQEWPSNFEAAVAWPKFSQGGLERVTDAVDQDGYEVVIVDTLARIRKDTGGKYNYQADSDEMAAIHDLTRAQPGLAIVVVHHNKKDDKPDDYIDALSGTTGIGGVPDHIGVLYRGRNEADAVLKFTSRDVPEHETAFSFTDRIWTEIGPAAEHELSKARRELYSNLVAHDAWVSNTILASELGKSTPTTLDQLRKLQAENLVDQDPTTKQWKAT